MLVFSDFLEDKVTHKGKVKASSHNRDLLNFLRNLFSLTGYKFLESFPSLRPPEAGFRYGSQISLLSGARGGNRTRTPLLEQDFKSCASTNFATRARDFCLSLNRSPPFFIFSSIKSTDFLTMLPSKKH